MILFLNNRETLESMLNSDKEKEEILICIDSKQCEEFRYLYEESFKTYPIQKEFYEKQEVKTIKEWQSIINEYKENSLCTIKTGIVIDYFPQHEIRLTKELKTYSFNQVIGRLNYMDNCDLTSKTIHSILFGKYDIGFIYQHYFGLARACVTSNCFDAMLLPDAVYDHKVPHYGINRLVDKFCGECIKNHFQVYVRKEKELLPVWKEKQEKYKEIFRSV